MTDPLFWLVLSFLFVTVSLTIALVVAIPALREMARAARSAEKLFDTLRREFPPTLEAIRLTGMEISDLTDDVSQGVQSAGNVVKQVDESLSTVRKQAQKMQSGTRSLLVGAKVAWRTFVRSQKPASSRRTIERLPPPRPELEFDPPQAQDPYPLSNQGYTSVTAPDSHRVSGHNRRLPIEPPAQSAAELVQPETALPPYNAPGYDDSSYDDSDYDDSDYDGSGYGRNHSNGAVPPIQAESGLNPLSLESVKQASSPKKLPRREPPTVRQKSDPLASEPLSEDTARDR